MSHAVLSSLAAAVLVALASYMLGLVQPILLLGFGCMAAWVTHDEAIDSELRRVAWFIALASGVIAFFWVLVTSFSQGVF